MTGLFQLRSVNLDFEKFKSNSIHDNDKKVTACKIIDAYSHENKHSLQDKPPKFLKRETASMNSGIPKENTLSFKEYTIVNDFEQESG